VEDKRKLPVPGLVDGEMQAAVQAAACRSVAEMLAEDRFASPPKEQPPDSDGEFEDRLILAELGLIADAEQPLRISLRVAVLRTARDALRTFAEIRALPESGHRSPPQRC
jgi:hypothetical protein